MKSTGMLNRTLLVFVLIFLSSCGILRQKEKTKVVVKVDSIHQQSALQKNIDTSNNQYYKKTTYYVLPLELFPQNYPNGLINSTKELANSATGLKTSTINVLSKAEFGQVLATVEEWLSEKKGISETKAVTENTAVKKENLNKDTNLKGDTKMFTILAIAGGIILIILIIFGYFYIRSITPKIK